MTANRLRALFHPRRVAGEHCCSPAPSERHVSLSVYAAQASPKAPRGTRWGVRPTCTILVWGQRAEHAGDRTRSTAAVIGSVSQAGWSDGLVRRHPREVRPLSRRVILLASSTPI